LSRIHSHQWREQFRSSSRTEDTAAQIFDVGLYKIDETGTIGAVVDIDVFDVDSAFGVTEGVAIGDQVGKHVGKYMWDIAGAASEDAGEDKYFVCITTDASNGVFDAAAWRIGATIFYTAGD